MFNMAGALPFSVAPAIAPFVLSLGGGSYGVLYAVAGACAILGRAGHPAGQARAMSRARTRCSRGIRP